MTGPRLIQATTEERVRLARDLFEEYAASLGFDLAFQGFPAELAGLPGEYAPPAGRLLLAECDGRLAGCAALRPMGGGACEMKRMYVRPEFRGRGIGRLLAVTLIEEARGIGYERMLLDTIAFMKEAIVLYRSLGFREIAPYRHNPVAGAAFLHLALRRPPGEEPGRAGPREEG
jgi:GNAT superfamily N-acetyltransferase